MSRTFTVDKKFYGDFKLYNKTKMIFEPGLTILVGCNGMGKSTLLSHIKYELSNNNIKFISYDNVHDGGRVSVSKALCSNSAIAAELFVCSEGEQIHKNIYYRAREIGKFVRETEDEKEIWILFDAIDSGMSIDNIIDIKENLFHVIIELNKVDTRKVYIVCSANSYEMVSGEKCFDVYNGKYREFKTYNTYKNFILKNREIKDKNIDNGD